MSNFRFVIFYYFKAKTVNIFLFDVSMFIQCNLNIQEKTQFFWRKISKRKMLFFLPFGVVFVIILLASLDVLKKSLNYWAILHIPLSTFAFNQFIR